MVEKVNLFWATVLQPLSLCKAEPGFGVLRAIMAYPRNLRTHILRLLGPKTIQNKAFGLF